MVEWFDVFGVFSCDTGESATIHNYEFIFVNSRMGM